MCVRACVHVCVCVRACVHVCVCVCVCVSERVGEGREVEEENWVEKINLCVFVVVVCFTLSSFFHASFYLIII